MLETYTPRFDREVHVLAWGKRHALDKPRDPRVRLLEPTSSTAPDLIVVAVREDYFATARANLTPDLIRRIARGEAALVFDCSGEGQAFDRREAKAVHRLLAELGIPAAHVAYLTQNRDHDGAYRAWCGDGILPMTIVNYDDYIRRFFQEHDGTGEEAFAQRKAEYDARSPVREKRFVCLNFSPRQTKVMLLLKLIEGGQDEQGFISFPGFDRTVNSRAVAKNNMVHDLVHHAGFEDMAQDLAPLIDKLAAKGNMMLGQTKTATGMPHHYKGVSGDMALDEYNRSWFTVITETEMTGTRRVTEKPFKALANFSPMVVLGNAGSMALIREFGFRTFDAMFDESYDREPNDRRRFEMVYEEIRRLCAMPEAQLRKLDEAVAETVVSNAERALLHMPRLYRQVLEPKLVDDLMALRR